MNNLLPFIVIGLTSGSIYSLTGVGLVLTYKTSGIFNFAMGAIGTVSAYMSYSLRTSAHLNSWIACPLAVIITGVLFGLAFEFLARYLAQRSLSLQIVATVGIVILIESIAQIVYGVTPITYAPFLPSKSFNVLGTFVGLDQIITTALVLVLTAGLYVFFRRARLGLAMRGIVEDPVLLNIAGTNPMFVRRCAWIIGCTFAALSGVLLAPSVDLDAVTLTLLVVQAFGAAAIGAFTNLPLTYVGGLVVGVIASILTKYSTSGQAIVSGLPTGLPFIVLFVVLLFFPKRRLVSTKDTNNLREVAARPWVPPMRIQVVCWVCLLILLITVPHWTGFRLGQWTTMLAYVILFMSLGLLVRTAGQVSLCQVTFMAIGACAFSHLTTQGVPWLPALLLAGLITIPISALLAVPAIRLSGLYLALMTFGFGILVQYVFYSTGFMFGSQNLPLPMPVPYLSWLGLGSDTSFYYVALFTVAVIAVVIVLCDRSRLGRLLRGAADSPISVRAHGLSLVKLQVLVFCMSGFLAAIAGALLGMSTTVVTSDQFDPMSSLTLVVLVMIVAGSMPGYAFLAAAGLVLFPAYVQGGNVSNYEQILFGVAAVLVAVMTPPSMPERITALINRLGGRSKQPKRQSARVESPAPAGRLPRPATVGGPHRGLDVSDVIVRFGGLVAVDGVTLQARPGRITGLIGPNGAGKTTLFNASTGVVRCSSGNVAFNSVDVTRVPIPKRAQMGLGRTFQQTTLFNSMTVEENIALGCEARIVGGNPIRQLVPARGDRRTIDDAVADVLSLCGLHAVAGQPAALLTTGQRRAVELARCLAGEFGMVLLDEPSAGLDRSETSKIAEVLRNVVRLRGTGVLIVEHDMNLVMELCDYIYVLDFGKLIFEGTPQDVINSDVVRAAYLGSEFTQDTRIGDVSTQDMG